MSVAESSVQRATCYRCRKPTRLCLCARIPLVSHRTAVLILQHHRERFHPVGTTRLARLGLSATQVIEVAAPISRPALAERAALLFPGPASRELSTLELHERPQQLVVLDGTWRQARQLFRENAWVRELPQVSFTPRAPSRYRIRKQPAAHCVSTLEAILEALRCLEPDSTDFESLLTSFDEMIDEQAEFMQRKSGGGRYQKRKPRLSRAVPSELLSRPDDMLLIYGETAPLDVSVQGRTRQLVRWSALRLATGECFDALVEPLGKAPLAAQLEHMGIAANSLHDALPPAKLSAAWRAFLRPSDLILAWHPAVLRMLAWVDSETRPAHSVKVMWSNLTQKPPGKLEDFVAQRALSRLPAPLDGRAGQRLAAVASVAKELIAVAPRFARMR